MAYNVRGGFMVKSKSRQKTIRLSDDEDVQRWTDNQKNFSQSINTAIHLVIDMCGEGDIHAAIRKMAIEKAGFSAREEKSVPKKEAMQTDNLRQDDSLAAKTPKPTKQDENSSDNPFSMFSSK